MVGGIASLALLGQLRSYSRAAERRHGELVFNQRCKDCHEPAIEDAPSRVALAVLPPQDIIASLKMGSMTPMAEGLTDADLTALAAYLGPSGKL